MILLFLAAFIVITIAVKQFYSLKQTAKIFAIPVFLGLTVLVTLAILDIPLSFFTMVGILLVIGLVLSRSPREGLGVPLSPLINEDDSPLAFLKQLLLCGKSISRKP